MDGDGWMDGQTYRQMESNIMSPLLTLLAGHKKKMIKN